LSNIRHTQNLGKLGVRLSQTLRFMLEHGWKRRAFTVDACYCRKLTAANCIYCRGVQTLSCRV